ncbi:MAG TPA: glycosyltransferase family 39 protein [Candidatus Limnocylindrales bacterium]|nr:glycosyltransferase family 39 protein [Candidatus Limnocylindrales bacterium]
MRIPLVLYALALVVRIVLIWHFPDPAYPDSFYYVDVARNLAEGRGFTIDLIWIFPEVGGTIPADPTLPIPSNAHWMPLASLVQVPFIALLGATPWASALPFALIGSIAAPLTWAMARDAGARDVISIGAGLLVAIPVLTTAFMVQPDNFSLYQPLVLGALWMGARGLKGSPASFAIAGLLAGLATLSRNDGLLVLGALGLAFLWDRWRRRTIPWSAAFACVAVFVLVMAPWWLRQLAIFGSISPSSTSGKVFFIRDIGEWNSISTPATLDHLLGMGAAQLAMTRLGGLVAAVMIYVTLVAGFILAPFMVVGAWRRRRSVDFGPFFVYAGLLFAFSALVSAIHVPGGTFIHSAIALAPHSYVLALEGIAAAVAWIAARRRAWDATAATRVFVSGAVAFSVVAAAAGALFVHAEWAGSRMKFQRVGEALDDAGAPLTARVMSIDAAGTKYWTGRGGVVLVNDPVATVESVARAYDIDWLVLDRADSVRSMAPVLDGGPRPDWLGAPVLAEGQPTQLALLPVVTSP